MYLEITENGARFVKEEAERFYIAEPPPLRMIVITSVRYRKVLDAMVKQLAEELKIDG